jgi:GntR family transcriptional repressor for pyruvate dehydrogenase complex
VAHLRLLISNGEVAPGQRMPSERDLATAIGVARPTVRAALRTLAVAGLIRSVRGVGNFVVEVAPERPRPAHLTSQVLAFTGSALEEMRRLVEGGGAALAAERATPEDCVVLAEEVSNLYAAVGDPPLFLMHDVRFHRAVAAASGNPLLASAVDQLTEAALDRARGRVSLASADALRHMAATHRRIYHAIRDHNAGRARAEMEAHLASPSPSAHGRLAIVR